MAVGSEKLTLISKSDELAVIAEKLRQAGWFALDLEFASEGRYVPDLCVVQVAWPGPDAGEALIDAMVVDITPILEVIGDQKTQVVTHAGRQDLALLGDRFSVSVGRFWDTQVAAAFVGIGEQVGYGTLVEALLGTKVDKGPQFTDWTQRPLSRRQLSYAAADVIHLRELWPMLRDRLSERCRLEWVREASAALAQEVSSRVPPDEKYRSVSGGGSLRKRSLGALVELAAWRETEALASNKPPSWILPDSALVELCRKLARNEAALRKVRGVGGGTVRQYGTEILAAIERGANNEPPAVVHRNRENERRVQPLAALIFVLIGVRCATETLAVKWVGSKADCEELVKWQLEGGSIEVNEDELPRMMRGWRREFIGDEALRLLAGEVSVHLANGGIVFNDREPNGILPG